MDISFVSQDVDYLLSPTAIRERCQKVFDLTQKGQGQFQLNLDKMPLVAKHVAQVTQKNYPDLKIPFHSRWSHFQAGGVDRLGPFFSQIKNLPKDERVKAKLDLVIVSVLLDAGAGNQWVYRDGDKTIGRSEGLAIASFRMFENGAFSSESQKPLQVDAEGLKNLTVQKLADGFQVSDENTLVGLDGRVELLKTLGAALGSKEFCGGARPGDLADNFLGSNSFSAVSLLEVVLRGFSPIWPHRISLGSQNMGDVWHFPELGAPSVDSLVPFHKLSQWLTYSLMEPFIEEGIEVTEIDNLTGLAEYRNGGLFLDHGVISFKDSSKIEEEFDAGDPVIVEWRALTICLLDMIADEVRSQLNLKKADFPLVKILEGGTWWAGREIAKEKRAGGGNPLKIKSDGTVF